MSRFVLVAGPFANEQAAKDTADALGKSNHSVFSQYKNDSEGYVTTEKEYFVERDTEAIPERIFGYTWGEIQHKQRGKH